MLLSVVGAQYTARRLQRIVTFADRVAAGDLTARISATSVDEIGQVATALDKTARKLEEKLRQPCRPASASSKPCSTPCRMPSSPSAPTAACNGPTAAWSASSRSAPA